MSGSGFWLLLVNAGLATLVLGPFLAVGIAVARDLISRRNGRRWSYVDVPGIGRLPVLNDGVHTGASCHRA
ncbi:MAG: hypothetical protein MUE73_09075 [Planctomycetes bacterium]|jgi:hypothetical protein|nr:hypothetical protein [Planctomycetota bacterium]